jgi:hypothetical protein
MFCAVDAVLLEQLPRIYQAMPLPQIAWATFSVVIWTI